jgi:hypothetical protein
VKKHFIPAAIKGSHISVRIAPAWRCIWRPRKAYDIYVDHEGGMFRIDCPRCSHRLLELAQDVEIVLTED